MLTRRIIRLLVPALTAGAVLGALPVATASEVTPGSGVDSRAFSTSKVVERVEIGRLGARRPLVVKRRKLTGRAASRVLTLDPGALARSVRSGSTESCFYARPQWKRYNGFGRLSSKAWYYMEWCARSGRVTRVLTLFCGGVGAQGFGFAGCSIRRGSGGYARVNVSGTWRFPFRIGPYTLLTRTITVSSRHYATGRYAGTWWRYQ